MSTCVSAERKELAEACVEPHIHFRNPSDVIQETVVSIHSVSRKELCCINVKCFCICWGIVRSWTKGHRVFGVSFQNNRERERERTVDLCSMRQLLVIANIVRFEVIWCLLGCYTVWLLYEPQRASVASYS
jgi:hypothetical protein